MTKIDIDQLLLMTEDTNAQTIAKKNYMFDIDELLEKTNGWSLRKS